MTKYDKIMQGFLKAQYSEGMSLADNSDLFDLTVIDGDPPSPYRYLLEFYCKGLVWTDGQVKEAEHFAVGVTFPPEYLRRIQDVVFLLTWIHPLNVFHANIRPAAICLGPIAPGTRLVELVYRCFDVITYNKVTPVESDALNIAACQWARKNMSRFPIDRRPLRRPGNVGEAAA